MVVGSIPTVPTKSSLLPVSVSSETLPSLPKPLSETYLTMPALRKPRRALRSKNLYDAAHVSFEGFPENEHDEAFVMIKSGQLQIELSRSGCQTLYLTLEQGSDDTECSFYWDIDNKNHLVFNPWMPQAVDIYELSMVWQFPKTVGVIGDWRVKLWDAAEAAFGKEWL